MLPSAKDLQEECFAEVERRFRAGAKFHEAYGPVCEECMERWAPLYPASLVEEAFALITWSVPLRRRLGILPTLNTDPGGMHAVIINVAHTTRPRRSGFWTLVGRFNALCAALRNIRWLTR